MPKKTESSSLRPVGARALKSAMDTLRPYLAGASILDLFAGKGRFAYAALENGAEKALLVEKNRTTAQQLEGLRPKKLSAHHSSRVLCKDVWKFLESPHTVLYDIIFVDPPFSEWNESYEKKLFAALPERCHPGTILLVKIPSTVLISSHHPGFTLWKITYFGESQLAYFTYDKANE